MIFLRPFPAKAFLCFALLLCSLSVSALSVSLTVHNPCSGCTGQINALATGGTTPYQYSWDGGTTWYSSGLYYGLCPGTYTVIAKDALNATATATGTVLAPVTIVFTATPTNCSSWTVCDGSITFTVSGGTPPYVYAVTNSSNVTTNYTTNPVTGLCTGTYTVTVLDQNNCGPGAGSVIVTISAPGPPPPPPTLVVTATGSMPLCPYNCNHITASASGGTPPYLYSFTGSGGPWQSSSMSSCLTGNGSQINYSVCVKDATGSISCTTLATGWPYPFSGPIVTVTQPGCGQCNGSLTMAIMGSNAPFHYTINSFATSQTTSTFSNLCAGTYTCSVTDNSGCMVGPAVVTLIGNNVTATTTQVNPSCNGSCNGSITVAASPSGSYHYSIDGGTTYQNGATFSSLCAGTYTLTTQNISSPACMTTNTVTLTAPAVLTAGSTQTNILCYGSCTGTAAVSVTGGSPSYSYSWSPMGGTGNSAAALCSGNYTCTITDSHSCSTSKTFSITQATAIVSSVSAQTDVLCNGTNTGAASITASGGTGTLHYNWLPSGGNASSASGLNAGNYTVNITDDNSCLKTQTLTITAPPVLSATSTQSNISCNGATDGSAAVAVSGGTAGYTYSWSPSGGTAASANGLAPGNYSCTITDAHLCSLTKTFLITEPAVLATSISSAGIACHGGNASATVTASGGTFPYAYSWSNGGTNSVTGNLSPGIYSCLVTDAHNCTSTQSISITEPAALVTSSSQTDLNCNGTNTGLANVNVSGGTAAYSYSWSNGGTTATISNLAAGNYSCVITDAHNCTLTQSFTITAPAALAVNASQTNVSCNGGTNGTAALSVSGGVSPYTYSWNSGGNAATENNLAAGNYTCLITDANNCTFTQNTTITEPSVLAAVSSQTAVSCYAGTNGTASVAVTGGTLPYNYSWSSGGNAATENNLNAGNYSCTVTDAHNCTLTQSFTLSEPGALTLTSGMVGDVSCNGGADGSVSLTVDGGTLPYTYSWSSGGNAATENNLAAGTYSCIITDAHNCTFTQSVTITEPPALAVVSSQSEVSCFSGTNGSATLTVNGGTYPYTYNWSSGGNAATENNLSAGNYSCMVTDAHNCALIESLLISEPAALIASVSQTDVTCYGEANGAAAITVSGGTPAYTYSWSNGGNAANTNNLAAGNYSCTITDAHNCVQTQTLSIVQPPALNAASTVVNTSCNLCNGSLSLLASGGTSPYSYLWGNTAGPQIRENLCAGDYTIIVSDANGCTDTLMNSVLGSVGVTIDSLTSTPSPSWIAYGTASVYASGTAPFTFEWDNAAGNQTTQTASNLFGGTYCVRVSDANGCWDTACVNVSVILGTEINATATEVFTCFPNPFNNTLSVSGEGMYHLYLYNSLGQVSIDFGMTQLSSAAVQLEMPQNLPAGLYFIRAENTSGTKVIRLTKE